MSDTTDDMEMWSGLAEISFCDDEIEEFDFNWTTRDNKKIKIWEMTDKHLVNAINYSRNHNVQYILLEYEASRRGLNYE